MYMNTPAGRYLPRDTIRP